MDQLVTVMYLGKPIAIIFRKNIRVTGVKFFTDALNPFQVGIHNQPKGLKLTPHIHVIEHTLSINEIQELLFVQSGKIRVRLLNAQGEKIRNVILNSGDSILLMSEGHGVEFLEQSNLLEVKQGPYPGTTHAKIYLNNQKP